MNEARDNPDFFMRAVLSVSDVMASVAYYRDKLAFVVLWMQSDDKGPVAAGIERSGIDLMLLRHDSDVAASARPAVVGVELHEHVDLARLHDELQQRGARIRRAPVQVAWQPKMHQMDIEDIDGNQLLFWGDLP